MFGRAFAMRLVQLGMTAYVIGESVTPIVKKGDAVFILSGRGESYSSMQTANIVRREGANLIVLTARRSSKLAHAATLLISLDLP
ncbi:MAG: SIS domain-containing protein, partial [Thermoplasmata archaeon]|nr:SIS domain-containing protein [Thermoplasmata archaeon]